MSFLGDSGNVTSLTDIATNSANIAINTANISTNTTNIATNTSDITALETLTADFRVDGDTIKIDCDKLEIRNKGYAIPILTLDAYETLDDSGASVITGRVNNSLFIRADGNGRASNNTVYNEGLILMGTVNDPRVADESHLFVDKDGDVLIGSDRKDLPNGGTDKLKVMGNTNIQGDLNVSGAISAGTMNTYTTSSTNQTVTFYSGTSINLTGFSLPVGTYLITATFHVSIPAHDDDPFQAHFGNGGSPIEVYWGTHTNGTGLNHANDKNYFGVGKTNPTNFPIFRGGGSSPLLIFTATSAGAYPQLKYYVPGKNSEGSDVSDQPYTYDVYAQAIRIA